MLLSRTFILAFVSSFFIKQLREFTQLFWDSLDLGGDYAFRCSAQERARF